MENEENAIYRVVLGKRTHPGCIKNLWVVDSTEAPTGECTAITVKNMAPIEICQPTQVEKD